MNAQQLKNSILQEAIEGRLVPQDPNDEPASLLLDKIRKEKAKMVKEGKLKKKDLEETPISEDEKPFVIPESWEWVRFGTITINRDRERIPLSVDERSKLEKKYDYYGASGIIDKVDRFLFNKPLLLIGEDGANLINRSTPIAFIARGEYWVNNHAHVLDYLNEDLMQYVCWYINSISLVNYVTGTAQPKMNQEKMNSILVALPTLAEQKRIVAKIEELLPKVDEYGKAQESLDKLNEELPERLKKSILQEAIEGRLVPQDPNDEPASVLLDNIRKEKERLVKEGKLKKKDLVETPVEEDEKPFEIPESWEWTRLGDHITAMSGLAYKKEDLASFSKEYVRVLRGGNISFGSWYIKDDDVMIGKQFVNEELILKKGMFISPAVTSLEHMGKTALIRDDQKNIVAGGFVLMLLPHYKNEQYWEYLNVLFQTGYYRESCKSITNKSGQAFFNLSRAKLLEMLIPIPPLAEQKRIVAKVEQLLHEIDKLKV